jgi:predicted nucleic acid-binding protein
MSAASFFLDTNILIYAIDPEDSRKYRIAQDLVNHGHASSLAVISYQVVQEWFNFCLHRAKVKLSVEEASTIYRSVWAPLWKVQSSPELLELSLELRPRYNFSWYDSLIVAAALQSNCGTLHSEDLQHGQVIRNLTIKNPFAPA